MAEQATLSWGPNNQHRLLNTSLPRVDGPVKATGIATYTFDAKPAGMLYGRVLLAPMSRGKVTSFDATAAEKIPGVMAVIQGESEIKYEGTVVAAVAATTAEIAADALRAISIKYESLPFIVTPEAALQPDAPNIFKDGNVRQNEAKGSEQKATDALSKCDATIDVTYSTPRLHHSCLETHGIVVDYTGGDTATVYASTQSTFSIPGDAAGKLGLDQSKVTAIVQNMGGGFGSKFGIGVPGRWACELSKLLKQPVKLMLTRVDEFLAGGNGPGSLQKIRAGVTKAGALDAMIVDQFTLGGVGRGSLSGLPYIYECGTVYRKSSAIHTNEDSSVALRAPGHPQASFAMESMMDELAEKIGMDPVEFRKKNKNDDIVASAAGSWGRKRLAGRKASR